jgi:hypothetical protein
LSDESTRDLQEVERRGLFGGINLVRGLRDELRDIDFQLSEAKSINATCRAMISLIHSRLPSPKPSPKKPAATTTTTATTARATSPTERKIPKPTTDTPRATRMESAVTKAPPADREAGRTKIEDYSPEKGQTAVVESSLEKEVPRSDERTTKEEDQQVSEKVQTASETKSNSITATITATSENGPSDKKTPIAGASTRPEDDVGMQSTPRVEEKPKQNASQNGEKKEEGQSRQISAAVQEKEKPTSARIAAGDSQAIAVRQSGNHGYFTVDLWQVILRIIGYDRAAVRRGVQVAQQQHASANLMIV